MNIDIRHLASPMVEDAYIVRWLKKEGDYVKKGEPLAEVETSKVSTDVRSPCEGILKHILCEDNSRVSVHDNIAIIE